MARITFDHQRAQTIADYVRQRRADPARPIEFGLPPGALLDAVAPELARFQISPELIFAAGDADPDAISELSLLILGWLASEENLKGTGASQLASRGETLPPKLASWLVAFMLEAVALKGRRITPDFHVLLRATLPTSTSHYEAKALVESQRSMTIAMAVRLAPNGPLPSIRRLAKALGVEPSTVARWFQSGDLHAAFIEEIKFRKVYGSEPETAILRRRSNNLCEPVEDHRDPSRPVVRIGKNKS